jgi:hypothetical protein
VLGDLPREQVANELRVSARSTKEGASGRARSDDVVSAIRFAVEISRRRLGDSLDHGATPERILTAYHHWRGAILETLTAHFREMTVSAISKQLGGKASDAKRLQRGQIGVRLDTALKMIARLVSCWTRWEVNGPDWQASPPRTQLRQSAACARSDSGRLRS